MQGGGGGRANVLCEHCVFIVCDPLCWEKIDSEVHPIIGEVSVYLRLTSAIYEYISGSLYHYSRYILVPVQV